MNRNEKFENAVIKKNTFGHILTNPLLYILVKIVIKTLKLQTLLKVLILKRPRASYKKKLFLETIMNARFETNVALNTWLI